jgi:hypothetical protein
MKAANDNGSLYLSEAAVAQRILGTGALPRWSGLATVLEREGLPRIDPLTGCRYWPAVRAFLDRRNGLSQASVLPTTADGAETWN